MINLLTDKAFRVRATGGSVSMSLPQVFAAAAKDEIEYYPNLRPHQEHPWHAFLAQLGAIAMINSNTSEPPKSDETWRQMLTDLTGETHTGEEPWHLVVDDPTAPAFLQPPASNHSRAADYDREILTPDQLDVTIGSKRHLLKDGTISQPETDHWIYALITRQTAGGYDGPRLYGSVRMNSGSGNRHAFCLTPSQRWGAHLTRDLRILARTHQGAKVSNLLLWTRTWDGQSGEQIDFNELEPHALFIEVSRRLRLKSRPNGSIAALRATSRTTRVAAGNLAGLVGDPWTLATREKAVTISPLGFTPHMVRRYLDPALTTLPLLARHHPEVDGQAEVDGPGQMELTARAFVQGQGKTHGYHELRIPLDSRAAQMLDAGEQQQILAQTAKERLDIIAEAQRILTRAVHAFTGNRQDANRERAGNSPAVQLRNELQQAMERNFWAGLQKEMKSEDPNAERTRWAQEELIPKTVAILRQAHASGRTNNHTKFGAVAKSLDIFYGEMFTSKKIPRRSRRSRRSRKQEE